MGQLTTDATIIYDFNNDILYFDKFIKIRDFIF